MQKFAHTTETSTKVAAEAEGYFLYSPCMSGCIWCHVYRHRPFCRSGDM